MMRFLVLLLILAHPLHGLAENGGEYQSEVVTEMDAYYSNVGLYLSPVDAPIPTVDSDSEWSIYSDLFLRSYIPRDIVLEASVNPMPLLGVALRQRAPNFYDSMQFSGDFNLVKSVTAGFDEPYALSLFLGNVVKYRAGDIADVGNNKGYMGYLFNFGNKHIKDNRLIDDQWLEFEWKVKGDREVADQTLGWSFRMGGRWHRHPEITDVYHIGIRRSHLDFEAPVLSWLLNSGVDYRLDLNQHDGSLIQQSLFFNKKLPVRAWGMAVQIELGMIWKEAEKYSGVLAGEGVGDEFQLVLRPNIQF